MTDLELKVTLLVPEGAEFPVVAETRLVGVGGAGTASARVDFLLVPPAPAETRDQIGKLARPRPAPVVYQDAPGLILIEAVLAGGADRRVAVGRKENLIEAGRDQHIVVDLDDDVAGRHGDARVTPANEEVLIVMGDPQERIDEGIKPFPRPICRTVVYYDEFIGKASAGDDLADASLKGLQAVVRED